MAAAAEGRSAAASEQTRVTWSTQLEKIAYGADVPLAPKAPERPKAAYRHPLPHQRLSEESFGYS